MKRAQCERLAEIGQFLRRVREDNELSISEVSQSSKVDRSLLYRFETARRSVSMLVLQKLVFGYRMTPSQQVEFAHLVLGTKFDGSFATMIPLKGWKQIFFEIIKLSAEDQKNLMEGLAFASEIEEFKKSNS